MMSTKSGASVIVAGRSFQKGLILGKKLYLKQSGEVGNCWNFFECFVLVLIVAGVRQRSLSTSTRLLTIL